MTDVGSETAPEFVGRSLAGGSSVFSLCLLISIRVSVSCSPRATTAALQLSRQTVDDEELKDTAQLGIMTSLSNLNSHALSFLSMISLIERTMLASYAVMLGFWGRRATCFATLSFLDGGAVMLMSHES